MLVDKPTNCHRCGGSHIAGIVYGLVDVEALRNELDGGDLVLGGCSFAKGSPEWLCHDCKHEWGDVGVLFERIVLQNPQDIVRRALTHVKESEDMVGREAWVKLFEQWGAICDGVVPNDKLSALAAALAKMDTAHYPDQLIANTCGFMRKWIVGRSAEIESKVDDS